MQDINKLLSSIHHHPETNQEMIEKQLKARDITSQKVLEAFQNTDRKLFVPEKYQHMAYADMPVTIGHGQTISQPYIVAFMTQWLDIKKDSKVLEIGAGCGYQTAILARLADYVYSIEVIPELIKTAKKNLKKADITNVEIFNRNGREGLPEHAKFDRIIVAAGSKDLPSQLVIQLAEKGKMIIPVGKSHSSQDLLLITKQNGKINKQSILPVRFVPLI
ncbi:MAG: protein-L-isoaspartate(D-aspartate) O-methyltransferase [Fidelibacterota bacterium]